MATLVKLVVIADDFTGALDTGVKLAQSGVSTTVVSRQLIAEKDLHTDADVLVINAETRRLPGPEAHRVVAQLTRTVAQYPDIDLYKKTDSVLRGNVGSELGALLENAGRPYMAFVPALPAQNRVTLWGMQMVKGKPLQEGVCDLYDPITSSYVPDIIAAQSPAACAVIPREAYREEGFSIRQSPAPRIAVFDAVDGKDLRDIAQALKPDRAQCVFAGCSGFAEMLPELMGLRGVFHPTPATARRMAVICGSVHPTSQAQLRAAQEAGVPRITLTASQLLGEKFPADAIARRAEGCLCRHGHIILDANDLEPGEKMAYAAQRGLSSASLRTMIPARLGLVAKALLGHFPDILPAFIGGDTLSGFVEQMDARSISPLREITPGCVLSLLHAKEGQVAILSKSGGFGEAAWLTEIIERGLHDAL